MSAPGPDWAPDPELLAAYADGELSPRDGRHGRVDAWLKTHPEGRAEVEALQRMRRLCREVPPPEPSAQAWQGVLRRLEQARTVEPQVRPRPTGWPTRVALVAACVGLFALGTLWFPKPNRDTRFPELEAVLPVAESDDVVVLSVEGADTQTLAVGQLPVEGTLELAELGEVDLRSVAPHEGDRMVPQVRLQGPHRPMIWARLESDEMEP